LHRLAQTATQGAIQNTHIGQSLKGSWGPQNHIVAIAWLSPHSNRRALWDSKKKN